MSNVMRFSTPELGELEQRLSMAASRAVALELEIFQGLVERVGAAAQAILAKAQELARLDVFAALAELAASRRFVRPRVDESRKFHIVAGRHPVVEMALARAGEQAFVPNDCDLSVDESRSIWLVTGPNMAGKSTFLRQNALIAIMAQMGSFVPAEEAHIGIVDRLFSRVGAADDLARGRSTFMVEMVETAAILNQAGERALVILDEIGRGTATFDGLSIAWASVEHLHEVNRCRALFATHFHELTALASRLARLANVTMKVREWQGEVIFLHEVGPGSADRSYGIQVARLAGLPPSVVARAAQVLEVLERSEQASARRDLVDDLPLFAAARPVSTPRTQAGPSKVEQLVDALLPDDLTPRDALEFLYRLKAARLDDG
jgi:DNA mismatch repair protein MutS